MDQTYAELLSKRGVTRTTSRDRYLLATQDRALTCAHRIYSTSQHCLEHLAEGEGLTNVCPRAVYGVNTYGLAEEHAAWLNQEARKAGVLFVAQDFEARRGAVLVEALDMLNKDREVPLQLHVVGARPPGECRRSWMRWHGYLAKGTQAQAREYWDLMSNAAVFVMPSLRGPLPGVIREAQYLGTPVITSHVWRSEQLLSTGHCGLIVEDTTPEAFAEAISEVLSDASLWNRLSDGGREEARSYTHVRENLTAYVEEQIAGSDSWPQRRRDELVGTLRIGPGLHRLLRRTKQGLLRLDRAAVKREAKLDGKWLLRTSDPSLSAADLAAAYKQLYQVERGWRDMKGALALRPVFQHREDRIRAQVQLCWLALLLIRVVENATGDTRRAVRDELERMHLVTLETSEGRVARRSQTTAGQRRILAALELPEPPLFSDFEVSATPD